MFRLSSSPRIKEFNINASPHILISRSFVLEYQLLSDYFNLPKNQNLIYLLNPSYLFDPFKFMPRLFTIITENGSYKFNIDMLKDTSSTIMKSITSDPDNLEYHLNTKDDEKIMAKLEKLYLGQIILISDNEIYLFKKICDELKIVDKIKVDYSRMKMMQFSGNFQLIKSNFYSFLKTTMAKTFTISTGKHEYKCNVIGVNSSKVIQEFLSKNPDSNLYEFDFKDDMNEFQPICDFFNFNLFQITSNNMDSLKKIAEILQIDVIIKDIDDFINGYKNQVSQIDEQQTIINSIEDIFESLYNIKNLTVQSVKETILQSKWSQKVDDVQELAAFILQVAGTDFLLHSYLVDLIESLSKEADESNNLNILIPFITHRLLISFNKNKTINLFIFKIHNRGFIKKDEILSELKKAILIDEKDHKPSQLNESYIVFIPEIFEILDFDLQKLLNIFEPELNDFIQFYFPDNIEKFNKMRESYEPDDQIARALRSDDVDTLQSIISKNQIDINKEFVSFNIFDEFIRNGDTKYIDYSAAYGSLSCFKYLLVNHATVSDLTLTYAVYGGNSEIIHTVDQQSSDFSLKWNNEIDNKTTNKKKTHFIDKIKYEKIMPAIIKHRNDILDWLLLFKYVNIIHDNELIKNILLVASENGNASAIAGIADKGFDFSSLDIDVITKIIQNASRNGFYNLLKMLVSIMHKIFNKNKEISKIFDLNSSFYFGNLSIFQYYNEITIKNIQNSNSKSLIMSISSFLNPNSLNKIVPTCFKYNYKSIIEYIFNNECMKMIFDSSFYINILMLSIENNAGNYFNYLIERFRIIIPDLFTSNYQHFVDLLSDACYLNEVEISKEILNIIFEQKVDEIIDFTLPFYNAAVAGSAELCQLFIDNKFFVNFELIILQVIKLANVKKDVLEIIIKNINQNSKEIMISCYLKKAIEAKNKYLVEYLLNENAFCDDALFEAVKTNEIEIVNLILNKNSESYFINQISDNGTALYLAVLNNNLEIVDRLLSIPEIDPNLSQNENKTPLIEAIINLNIDIVNKIIDFYGSNIKYQSWQLNEGFKIVLSNISSSTYEMNDKPKLLNALKRFIEIELIDLNCYSNKFTLLTYACKLNETEIVQMLIKLDKVNVNLYELKKGDTPLMIAIDNKNIELAKLLIEYDRTNINLRNFKNETALTKIVKNKLFDLVDMILYNEKFDKEKSRIDYAFYLSNTKMAKQLIKIENIDVNYREIEDEYPNNENKITTNLNFNLKHLISLKLDFKNETKLLSTKLILAVENNDSELIDMIINHPSFDPIKSHAKKAVFISCKSNNIEIFRKLIKVVNNDVNLFDMSGDSLIKKALDNADITIVSEIVNNETFDSRKNDFQQVFISYLERKSISIDIINLLIDFDKKHYKLIDFKNLLPNGETLLTIVTSKFYRIPEIVGILLENGADPNVPNKDGEYPLQIAIEHSNFTFTKALIDSGKIEFTLKFEFLTTTYLHLAARKFDPKIFKLFLDNELIDVNSKDSNGNTPLMDACIYHQTKSVNQLFTIDNLDYLHCNNDGNDALKILQKKFSITNIKSPQTKDEYCNILIKMMNKNNKFGFKSSRFNEDVDYENDESKNKETSIKSQEKEKNETKENNETQAKEIQKEKNESNEAKEIEKEKNESNEAKTNENENKKNEIKESNETKTKEIEIQNANNNETDENKETKMNSQNPKENLTNKKRKFCFSFDSKTNKPKQKVVKNKMKDIIDSTVYYHPENEDFSVVLMKANAKQNNSKSFNKPSLQVESVDSNSGFSSKSSVIEDQPKSDLSLQDEIAAVINRTLDKITPDQLMKISEGISAITEKHAKKMAQSTVYKKSDDIKEIEKKNQFKPEEILNDDDAKNDDNIINELSFNIHNFENDEDENDQNQFNYREIEFSQNDFEQQQWNLMMQMSNARNIQFNMIMQQHQQMMNCINYDSINNKNIKTNKHKTKKKKRKNQK